MGLRTWLGLKPNALPFVIVGTPRTGSTLLLNGLQQHLEINAYSELMHPNDRARAIEHAIQRHDLSMYYSGQGDAIKFLKKQVYERPGESAKAVGFKLHADFKQCRGTTHLLPRLKSAVADLRVIHMVRPNYLDALVSWEVALRTNIWSRPIGSGPSERKISVRIEPAAAATAFDRQAKADELLFETFSGPLYRRVLYPDLASNFANEMSVLYEFLKVSPCIASPQIEKQITRPPHEIVENYDELAIAFSGTSFARFFSDASESP